MSIEFATPMAVRKTTHTTYARLEVLLWEDRGGAAVGALVIDHHRGRMAQVEAWQGETLQEVLSFTKSAFKWTEQFRSETDKDEWGHSFMSIDENDNFTEEWRVFGRYSQFSKGRGIRRVSVQVPLRRSDYDGGYRWEVREAIVEALDKPRGRQARNGWYTIG